jgi:hypothetical protein
MHSRNAHKSTPPNDPTAVVIERLRSPASGTATSATSWRLLVGRKLIASLGGGGLS